MLSEVPHIKSFHHYRPVEGGKMGTKDSDFCFQGQKSSFSKSSDRSQRWKTMILPDINERYQEIMAQCRIDYKAMKNGSIIKPQLSTHEEEELKNENRISQRELKNEYEEKIAKLQSQNSSLKEELLYLRDQLLTHFSGKTTQTY